MQMELTALLEELKAALSHILDEHAVKVVFAEPPGLGDLGSGILVPGELRTPALMAWGHRTSAAHAPCATVSEWGRALPSRQIGERPVTRG